MSDPSARTFRSDFKRFFLRGLAILLPTVLTLWIVVKAYQFIDSAIAEPINRGVRMSMVQAAPYWETLRDNFDPTEGELDAALTAMPKPHSRESLKARIRADNINEWWTTHWYMNLIGLVVAIIAVYITGHVLGGFLGRKIYKRVERLITSLPVFKQVYPYVKQFVDFLLGEDKQIKFSNVVMVQYPRKGIWSIGFQTGSAMRAISEKVGDSVVVFIPWTPTPFTGYAITVLRNEVVELPISIEEALRFIVSGGVLVPEHQVIATNTAAALPTDQELERMEETNLVDRATASVKAAAVRSASSESSVQTTRRDRPEASRP